MTVSTLANNGHNVDYLLSCSWPTLQTLMDNLVWIKGGESPYSKGSKKSRRQHGANEPAGEQLPGGLVRYDMTEAEYLAGMGVTDPKQRRKLGLD